MLSNLFLNSVVEWSRLQFALTAIYHWLFVPLTLGLSFMLAIMETIYYKTGNEFWKKTVKFWLTIFGINFAIGVATGIILEFEFGTNWSNYSWFVGDIFGAPLAIEGIFAFFLESTFIAVMFFGWNKVSKGFHLTATWLTAFGANMSALWILVANAWMQNPVGMVFNPETARNEMANFWDVLFSPVAIDKFFHTVTSAYVLSAIVVIGVSAWYLLKGREKRFAKSSIVVAAIFGLLSSAAVLWTGDRSAYGVAQTQPMKLAAMEGLYKGSEGAGLSVLGLLTPGKEHGDGKSDYVFNIKVPHMLSLMGYRELNAFVPGVSDIIEGGYKVTDKNGEKQIALSTEEKIRRGKIAIEAFGAYKVAKNGGDELAAAEAKVLLDANFSYFGYGYLKSATDIIPYIPICYYSFRIMVGLGLFFILVFITALWLMFKSKAEPKRWILYMFLFSIPLVYIASEAGWIVAEMGRQPWTIQDLLPTVSAVSHLQASSVMTTFFLFFVLFTILLVAEIKILLSQIRKGPKIDSIT